MRPIVRCQASSCGSDQFLGSQQISQSPFDPLRSCNNFTTKIEAERWPPRLQCVPPIRFDVSAVASRWQTLVLPNRLAGNRCAIPASRPLPFLPFYGSRLLSRIAADAAWCGIAREPREVLVLVLYVRLPSCSYQSHFSSTTVLPRPVQFVISLCSFTRSMIEARDSIADSNLTKSTYGTMTNKPELNNDGVRPLKVPGFGVPLEFQLPVDYNHNDRFRHGVEDYVANRLTVREIAMISFMNAVTDKPDWHRKVYDDGITAKWLQEAQAQPRSKMSDHAFEWCIRELRDKAQTYERTGFVKALDCQTSTTKSDILITAELRNRLIDALKPLQESIDKDWHPNSHQKVLNLVHPSLYPVVYRRSRVLTSGLVGRADCLEFCGKGEVLPDQPEVEHDWEQGVWSRRFQWLPSEVKLKEESGTEVQITSYINNLHPVKHDKAYKVIENFISKAIPMWNECLSNERERGRDPRIPIPTTAEFDSAVVMQLPDSVDYATKVEELDEQTLKHVREYVHQPDKEGYEADSDDENPTLPENWEAEMSAYETVEWKYKRLRNTLIPEPEAARYDEWKEGAPETRAPVRIEEGFRAQGLQVIVKLSGIELTPQKRTYDGGNWHLEGMLNEHIVGTAIYYYDCNNVTESRLRFRQQAFIDEVELNYEQDDHEPLCEIFGTDSMRDEPAVQELGSLDTREGRMIAFPNTFQHKVDQFELADPSKPGHRRFLVLWLVDPHYRIMSTANVPPQQHEWWADETLRKAAGFPLPPELANLVMKETEDFPMSREDAEKLRLELMAERTSFADVVEQRIETYNLCEH